MAGIVGIVELAEIVEGVDDAEADAEAGDETKVEEPDCVDCPGKEITVDVGSTLNP